jgi:hypothetical protein
MSLKGDGVARTISRACAALLLPALLALPAAAAVLDGFETVSPWYAAPADGVALALSSAPGLQGNALRLDFDFQGRGGYAVARREVDLDLPENWEITFRVRGEALPNNLEFKLVDATGQNVWWSVRRDFQVSRDWQKIRIRKRQLQFAWGPAGGGELHHAAALELVVTAGQGGKGWVAFDELTFEPRPPDRPYGRTPEVASSADGVSLDFLEEREYGGAVIDWGPGPHATRYEVQISDDGAAWTTVQTVQGGNGGKDYLALPETESRHLRLRFLEGSGSPRIDVEPLGFSASQNDFFSAIARDAPRGAYPRYLTGEGAYWTVVGADGDTEEALLGEDGALEPGKRLWSVEPFLWVDGELVRWSDVGTVQSLEKGYLPIPTVTWRRPSISLSITAFAAGTAGRSVLFARYRLRNDSPERKRARLFLAVRPFQVNPSWQFLNAPGGVAEVRDIAWDGKVLRVDGRSVVPLQAPAGFGAAAFDQGEAVESLLRGELPPEARVSDPEAHASAALAWDFDLAPGEVGEADLAIPFHPEAPIPPIETALAETIKSWEEKLGRVEIRGPAELAEAIATMKSTLAWILIHRDGPAIQPGSRSYERSWIRDGALTSAALLRLGHEPEVRQFLAWYAPHQYPDGKVPCCVDARGADPVTENDSHGELLYLIAEHWRYARDRAFLEQMWPHVEKAVAWIDGLRKQRRTEEYRQPDKRRYFGLLPESISHEGYSSKPVHSYWDDFWALRGLKDAVELAGALGKTDVQARWAGIRDEFRTDLLASLRQTIADHGIDYIPGSAELGDFDATSTTIALEPAGELDGLPRKELLRTFERYWEEFTARRDGKKEWEAYTPYELRTVGTFVRLGWRDRAQELLDYFLNDRRPRAWNQWPEVVWRDPRAPKFLGDLPHGWVGSDFLRSFLDLFAIEEEDTLVLGAGIPDSWLAGEGVSVRGLRTKWGTLDLTMRNQGDAVRVRIGGSLRVPPGGVVIGETIVRTLPAPPADITIERKRR